MVPSFPVTTAAPRRTLRAAAADAELLLSRGRLVLRVVLGALVAFTLKDIWVDQPHIEQLIAMRAAVALFGLVVIWWLPSIRSSEARAAIMVGFTVALCLEIAASNIVSGDRETALLLLLTVLFATAVLLPWGVRAQAAVAVGAGLSGLWHMLAMGAPAIGMARELIGLTLALATSVLVAGELARQRAAQQASAAALAARARSATLRAEVGAAMSGTGALDAMLQRSAQAVVDHLDAAFARVWLLDEAGEVLVLRASAGLYTHLDGPHGRVPVGHLKIGLIAAEQRPHLTSDVENDPRIGDHAWARREGMVAFAGYPLLAGGRLVGVLALFARHTLGGEVPDALAAVADVVALGVAREKAKAALVESERRFATIADSAPVMIWMTDAGARLTHANRAVREFIGAEPSEEDPPDLLLPIIPADRAETTASIAAAVTERRTVNAEFRARRGDGATRWLLATAVPRLAADGALLGLVGMSVDITERREMEDALREAHAAATAADEAKSRFLATMSHELRTPMNGILGMSTLLADTPLDAEQGESLAIIHQSAESLLGLINDVLDLSKIEAGKVTLERARFSLRDVVHGVLRTVAVQAHANGVELIADVAADVPDEHIGDAARLRQVLLNLVGNAVKFTAGGEVVVEARIAAGEAGGPALALAVRDTGIGIPTEKQASVFEAFVQADDSVTREYGGTGLGLPIAKRLVELMEGTIGVESFAGVGTTFFVTLPLAVAPAGGERSASQLGGVRVLVADSSARQRAALAVMLEHAGARVIAVGDAVGVAAALRDGEAAGDPVRVAVAAAELSSAAVTTPRRDGGPAAGLVVLVEPGRRAADEIRAAKPAALLVKPAGERELVAAVAEALGRQPTASDQRPAAPNGAQSRMRILVAEDNRVNAAVATKLLERRGHQVTVVGDGAAAVAALDEATFDLVLMDVQMPVLDGIQATARIRARERDRGGHIWIVAVTANAMRGDAEACLAAGMDHYVSKPIRREALDDAIARAQAHVTGARASQPDSSATLGLPTAAFASPSGGTAA